MKKIIAINGGPRKGWNTDSLVEAAAKGAQSAGAETEYIDLFALEKNAGCVACFGCKTKGSYGRCVKRDGLTEVLEKIRSADGLILGSPIYLGETTASFRALYERLVFQSLTYNAERPCCNGHMIPVLLILTSNCPEEAYGEVGYIALIESYKQYLSRFVGPTEVLTCGNTLQVEDYGKYDWTRFDPEEKKRYHDETFGNYLDRAFRMGAEL